MSSFNNSCTNKETGTAKYGYKTYQLAESDLIIKRKRYKLQTFEIYKCEICGEYHFSTHGSSFRITDKQIDRETEVVKWESRLKKNTKRKVKTFRNKRSR